MKVGMYPGPANGVLSLQMEDAIAAYQSKHGLEVTGSPSAELLKHMEVNL